MYKPSDITNSALLSAYLRTTPDQLDILVKGLKVVLDSKSLKPIEHYPAPDSSTVYQKFYLPKRNKRLGFRVVYKVWSQFAKDILKVLKFNLDDIYVPHECVHGFVHGRNTQTNAVCHLSK